MKVCLVGTFYPLYKGHQQLLRKAFQVAGPQGFVFIGVTTSAMVKKKGPIASLEKRKAILMQFIQEERIFPKVSIQPLTDKYGPTLHDDFDAIIVSPETEKTAEEINENASNRGNNLYRSSSFLSFSPRMASQLVPRESATKKSTKMEA